MRHTLHAGKDLLLLIRPILTYMPSIREPSGRSRRTVGSREQKLDFIFVLPFLVLLAHRVSFFGTFLYFMFEGARDTSISAAADAAIPYIYTLMLVPHLLMCVKTCII